jgi:hypothetical protein
MQASGIVLRPLLLGLFALFGCERAELGRSQLVAAASSSARPPENPEIAQALATLQREEEQLKKNTDFAALPPSSRSLGANPYAVVPLQALGRSPAGELPSAAFAALLRGDSRVVLLDARLTEIGSAKAPASANALAAAPGGSLFVVGPLGPEVFRYRVVGGSLEPLPALRVPSGAVPRAVLADASLVVVADFVGDRLFVLPAESAASASASKALLPAAITTCRGPFRLAHTPRWLAVACLFDHAVALHRRDARGVIGPEVARITHDGPIWSLAVLEDGAELVVGAGGVEDHPLERRDKVFGFIDSFAYVYRVGADASVTRSVALNVSELGVVTPKVAHLERREGQLWLTLLGYGSDRWLELSLDRGAPAPTRPILHTGVPGCADAVVAAGQRLCANPLFDAWVELSEPPALHAVRPRDVGDPSARERLGEALFYTTLMAPDASSEGRLSRFTCETCHFEGGTDGRVHHSGRDSIRVSTRPLFGLLNAAPHFSRAHDPDLTSVSHNEFGVANRGNPVDPWFALDPARFPWLIELGVAGGAIAPLDLRRALLAFLGRFSHEENPAALARPEPRFTNEERRGAELFRAHCQSCHAARLMANDPESEVAFERWERLVLTPEGPIVWSSGVYAKTGIEPYVERRGTRVPSLRRLYQKRPYLTNGSAATLADVLSLARLAPGTFLHGAAPASAPAAFELRSLDDAERGALLAFLRTL